MRALLGIALGCFMVLLDTTVLAVAEPDLASSLGSSTAGLQWAATGYSVAFGALLPSAGAAADRYGAHRAFRFGIAAFGTGCSRWPSCSARPARCWRWACRRPGSGSPSRCPR
ncbi:MFS transporter [Kitasatospora sp. NPDC101157]|uniref:MFS transporter n=1 Tax=Kitasatospora sp. NPDC101157 TaxID=3364098 RepID=UPI00381ECEFF